MMLVADSSKFLRAVPARIAHLSDGDVLATDRLSSPETAALCAANEVEAVEASGPTEAAEVSDENPF